MNRRNTIQRDLIAAAVRELDHPTAGEVYYLVAEKYPSISKATVYRNLGQLAEQGFLRRVESPGAADHFDATLPSHYHVMCKSCGKTADVDLPYMEELLERISHTHGYEIQEHDLILRGLCPECKKQAEWE